VKWILGFLINRYTIVAFLVFYAVTNPGPAASLIKKVGSGLSTAATGAGSFLNNLG
jgi:hypothetical protein